MNATATSQIEQALYLAGRRNIKDLWQACVIEHQRRLEQQRMLSLRKRGETYIQDPMFAEIKEILKGVDLEQLGSDDRHYLLQILDLI